MPPAISRIDSWHEQPRWDTLHKISAALGLSFAPVVDPRRQCNSLTALRWSSDRQGEAQPDWTRWRAFADQLRLHPEIVGAALAPAPAPTGSHIDNRLAATAEKLADEIRTIIA